jgi:hypothetical protein
MSFIRVILIAHAIVATVDTIARACSLADGEGNSRQPCPTSCNNGGGPPVRPFEDTSAPPHGARTGQVPIVGRWKWSGCAHGRRWVIATAGVVQSLANSGFQGAWAWYWRGSAAAQYIFICFASKSEFSPWLSHVTWFKRLRQFLFCLVRVLGNKICGHAC